MELMFEVIRDLLSVDTLLISLAGTAIGVVLGAIPGMNGGIGIAVMLPFTYAMSPAVGLLFLGGMYLGSSYGGSISAILINCPGTSEAACTALEGYPMTRRGEGKRALYFSIIASGFGSFLGVFVLIFFTPILAKISVKFGPPEMMLLAICGLTIVGSLTGRNVLKGLVATLIGLFASMIGIASNTGLMRFTFGSKALQGGVDIIPAVIGLFALAEMLKQGSRLRGADAGQQHSITALENSRFVDVLKDTFRSHTKVLLKSSLIGTFIGVLPGTGGAIAAFLAYGEAKGSSKTGGFGKGNPEGIVAAESANNAAVGGSLVPMLSLGIPGSPTSAIMFGALTIHGLVPGQRLFTEHGEVAYTFLFGMLLTCIFMVLIGVLGIPLFSQILRLKVNDLIPVVVICSLVGAFSVRNSSYDVIVAIGCGILGWVLAKLDIPNTPVVLGLILGRLIENNFIRTYTIARSKKTDFFMYVGTRPICIVILLLTVYLIYANIRAIRREQAIKSDPDMPEGMLIEEE